MYRLRELISLSGIEMSLLVKFSVLERRKVRTTVIIEISEGSSLVIGEIVIL